ncbi:hypothetical protein NEUTE1DRAFT_122281 [Neurospora tetrasperma FGSC 2508]|uniref:Uncharacterized protein n=1 Tax=Neurospora tetrasperma (strain FGSC 2508 / ATCC MYA-4615 / P0657) TaxID=510951 RepID=F8MMS2_NEUT8|nr:uncharacterized protein NEUTE1DRAFT_122281 [Neurospora tetrasperma FGSC 2508]EGO57946.1 hypothetical protein NEUTE1DRAFT_122281 [Neurospora tetrasperma FGSC 2508]EGZ71759.1 hypothetical protein NEUTE2DRAFT_110678 [Neurospora tetrasperma FGSC 2509]
MPIQHGINMIELLAIHTFMNLKVLEAIGPTRSISLDNYPKTTEARDSLLGRMARPLAATGFIDQVEVQS